jgi:hypothetical protein
MDQRRKLTNGIQQRLCACLTHSYLVERILFNPGPTWPA